MLILAINTGSTSCKCALYENTSLIWQASAHWKEDVSDIQIKEQFPTGTQTSYAQASTFEQKLELLFQRVKKIQKGPIEAVGHRIIHGGELYHQVTPLTPAVIQNLKPLLPLAPLHFGPHLTGVEIAQKHFPDSLHLAVFDHAFHTSMPLVSSTYPIPSSWRKKGIRRFGFHGISYQSCCRQLQEQFSHYLEDQKVILCHLGGGSSLCAVKKGRSFETTMGFTPLEGLMMETRSGSIDPGVIFYLLREKHASISEVEESLCKYSGIYGITEKSEDLQETLENAKMADKKAELAVEMYIHHLKGSIGSLAAKLGGLDILVFTGGIGENSPEIRSQACLELNFLGIALDENKNKNKEAPFEISKPSSRVRTYVLKAQEEKEIVLNCLAFLNQKLAV